MEYGTKTLDLLFKSKNAASTDPTPSKIPTEDTSAVHPAALSSLTSTIASEVEREITTKDTQ